MYRRIVTRFVMDALGDTPVVFIQGPRQCGKSTLVQNLRDEGHLADYLTLDEAVVLNAAMKDPDGFISGLPDQIILDEVQRAPDLFRAIKRSVDTKRVPGRFLMTGSANALVLPKVSESLAGRMEVLTLWPLSQSEIEGTTNHFIETCFDSTSFTFGDLGDLPWADLVPRITAGGFPEVLARSQETRRRAWFESYITTILGRDVREMANVAGLREMPRLLQLCAARAAGLLNLADLARDAAMPQTTLQRYWTLFENTFLLRGLPAWSGNLSSRIVKAPKVQFYDTGLLCHLLDLNNARLRADALMAGAVLENFVGNEVAKLASFSQTKPQMYHFRSHAGQEVDFVLEDKAGRIVGIEVKKTASPGHNDFKGLRYLAEQTGDKFVRGIVLCTAASVVPFGEKLHAVPIQALWR
jgi:uncharacterized protein